MVSAKVLIPQVQSLARERVDALLARIWQHRVGLVVAPAGSGKSTLLAGFAASANVPVAWYRAESWDAKTTTLLSQEVNDEVLVAFEFGDIRRPYVIGSLHNGQDKPKLGSGLFDNGKVKRRGFISRKGHQFIFFDDASKAGMAFISSDGKLKISLNETDSEIHISSQGKVHVESQQDMTLESQANLSLKAGQGLKVDAGTNLNLKASSGASLEGGSQVEVKASGQLKITGAIVDVNSGALQVM